MCGQCVFLKEKYEKVGNGGGKKYYCEYLKDYVYGCSSCSNFKSDKKRNGDKVKMIVEDGKEYDNGIPVSLYFLLLLILIILGLILGVFQ